MGNENEKAEFNDAIGYLNRLNSIFYYCNNAQMSCDAYEWMNGLITLFKELSDEIKEKEIEKYREEIKVIQNKVNEWHQDKEMTLELFNLLLDFEMEMRKVFKKTGLKMKYQTDSRFDIG